VDDFPPDVEFGRPGDVHTYVRAPDLLVLHFDLDQDDDKIASALGTLRLTPIQADWLPVQEIVWRGGKLRVVQAETLDDAGTLLNFAATLPSKFTSQGVQLRYAAPIYWEEDFPATAVSPLLDVVIVGLNAGESTDELEQLAIGNNYQHEGSLTATSNEFRRYRVTQNAYHPSVVWDNRDALRVPGNFAAIASADFDWLTLSPFQMAKPNDPEWPRQWSLTRIHASDAWDQAPFVQRVLVAVIDDTFDVGHPDIQYADSGTWMNFGPDPAAVSDPRLKGHGTRVAGIIAATANNNRGFAGIAQGCAVIPIGLGPYFGEWETAMAVGWAVQQGAAVINMSLAGRYWSDIVAEYVSFAVRLGRVVCVAAGNDDRAQIRFPATVAGVLAVGASDHNDQRAIPLTTVGDQWGSNYGDELTVVAPGRQIMSTNPTWEWPSPPPPDGVGRIDATSAATPHVSGLAALILSRFPYFDGPDVRDIICKTCRKVANYAFLHSVMHPESNWNPLIGHGVIDCLAAIIEAGQRPRPVHTCSGHGTSYCGFIGPSPLPGYLRLYCSLDLETWYDIPRAVVLRSMPERSGGGPHSLQRTLVVVDRTAQLVLSHR